MWNVGPDGMLSLMHGPSFWAGGDTEFRSPAGIATNRQRTFLFVANEHVGPAVSVFSIKTIGALTLVPGASFSTAQSKGLRSIAAYPAKSRAQATSFDTCIEDGSNGNLLQINIQTGEYQFINCSGFLISGTGT